MVDPFGRDRRRPLPPKPKPSGAAVNALAIARSPSVQPYTPPKPHPAGPKPTTARTRPMGGPELVRQAGVHAVMVQPPKHQPQPSLADQEWANIQQAIGKETLRKASNPRVAALQSTLGAVTGIPALEHAARSHDVVETGVQAAAFLPLGRLGRAVKAAVGVGKAIDKAEHAAQAARAVPHLEKPPIPGAQPKVVREMTEAEAQKRLAKLDKQHEAMIAKFSEAVNPYTKEQAAAETRTRNTMRGRMAQGKKPATGKKAPESTSGFTSKKIPTVKQELAGLAEKKIAEMIAAHPEHPAVQQAAALIEERQQLRDALNARAEHAFGGGQGPPPELPSIEVPGPGRVPPSERPGRLPGGQPGQGQLFPRPASYGRNPATAYGLQPPVPGAAKADALFPRETVAGSKMSPQGQVFEPQLTQAQMRKANPPEGKIPRLPKGVTNERTAGQLGQRFRASQKGVKGLQRQAAEMQSAERGSRAQEAARILAANPTSEGMAASRAALRGEMGRPVYRGLEGFTPEEVEALKQHAFQQPEIGYYEKLGISEAFDRMEAGKAPRPYQSKLLALAYGKEYADHLIQLSKRQKALNIGINVANIPRSIQASVDVSGLGRQALATLAGHPLMTLRETPMMLRSAFSEAAHLEQMKRLEARPNFHLYQEGSLPITDLENVTQREEQFMSNYAEKITGGKYSPVRASGRAYVSLLNTLRANLFDIMVANAEAEGGELTSARLRSFGETAGSLTGRGQFTHDKLEGAAPLLNTLFFSPRLLKSRLDLLNPAYYYRQDPIARAEIRRSMLSLVGAVSTVLATAAALGAKVEDDPRSADWAKIRLGNTRVDLLGGFQQPMRLAAQELSQSTKSSTTGKITHFGRPGPASMTGLDPIITFTKSKLAPVPGVAASALEHQLPGGGAITPQGLAMNELVPLGVQDAVAVGQSSNSVPAGVGAFGLSAVGLGVQNYKGKKPKARGGDVFGRGGSASKQRDPYRRGSSSSAGKDVFGR